jgi:predicted nucleic acid-binding protein
LYNRGMEVVADASVFLAAVLDEADRQWVIEKTFGRTIVSPEVLPYEIANALIAVGRKGRLTDAEILEAFEMTQKIPVTLLPVRIPDALRIAVNYRIYAYDAYYVQCCVEAKLPLISLDKRMCEVAENLGIEVVR